MTHNVSPQEVGVDMGKAWQKLRKEPSSLCLASSSSSSSLSSPTSFLGISRSIVACERCRTKKTKCDQNFPSCARCASLGEPCISVDPATGRAVSRSYVVFLEDRLRLMMVKLRECGVDPLKIQGNIPATSEDTPCNFELLRQTLEAENQTFEDYSAARYEAAGDAHMQRGVSIGESSMEKALPSRKLIATSRAAITLELGESSKDLENLGTMTRSKGQEYSAGDALDSYLGDSSGISFAKLVFTAVNFRQGAADYERERLRAHSQNQEPTVHASAPVPAPGVSSAETGLLDRLYLPTKGEAERLLSRYFAHSNSQLPVVHREFFVKKYFEPVYGSLAEGVSLASDHTLVNSEFKLPPHHLPEAGGDRPWFETWNSRKSRRDLEVPARYRLPLFFLNIAFAIGEATCTLHPHSGTSGSYKRRAAHYKDSLYRSSDRLEALSGMLLLAIYSIMRPNAPGVWYLMGPALRLAVDLGLHAEKLNRHCDPFTKELRRRLFWCTYALDRQICVYFGRPFGIPDENITARFPSALDDALIAATRNKVTDYSSMKSTIVSHKVVSLALFQMRRIEASIVQVLYAPSCDPPPPFSNLEEWRAAMESELDNWYNNVVPKTSREMNCGFDTELFELNYYHSKIMIYGLSPKSLSLTPRGCEVVYHSSKAIIDVYYDLCNRGKIKYTWIAVHNLFIAGMSYLYTVYNSNKGGLESIDETKECCSKLLQVSHALYDTCDAARNCYRIFQVLFAAVITLRSRNVAGSGSSSSSSGGGGGGSESQNLAKTETPLRLVAPDDLDQFFFDLNRLSSFLETSSDQPHFPSAHSDGLNDNDEEEASDAAKTKSTHKDGWGLDKLRTKNQYPVANDGERVYDMLHQMSTESIWNQFFGNVGSGGSDFRDKTGWT